MPLPLVRMVKVAVCAGMGERMREEVERRKGVVRTVCFLIRSIVHGRHRRTQKMLVAWEFRFYEVVETQRGISLRQNLTL